MKYVTTDPTLSAYLQHRGAQLQILRDPRNPKRSTVLYILQGPQVLEWVQAYRALRGTPPVSTRDSVGLSISRTFWYPQKRRAHRRKPSL